ALEWRVKGIVGAHQRLFAIQDERIPPAAVVKEVDLQRAKGDLDPVGKPGVRVRFEGGIREVGDLTRKPMELDNVRSLDVSHQCASASFVDAKQRIECVERTPVYE